MGEACCKVTKEQLSYPMAINGKEMDPMQKMHEAPQDGDDSESLKNEGEIVEIPRSEIKDSLTPNSSEQYHSSRHPNSQFPYKHGIAHQSSHGPRKEGKADNSKRFIVNSNDPNSLNDEKESYGQTHSTISALSILGKAGVYKNLHMTRSSASPQRLQVTDTPGSLIEGQAGVVLTTQARQGTGNASHISEGIALKVESGIQSPVGKFEAGQEREEGNLIKKMPSKIITEDEAMEDKPMVQILPPKACKNASRVVSTKNVTNSQKPTGKDGQPRTKQGDNNSEGGGFHNLLDNYFENQNLHDDDGDSLSRKSDLSPKKNNLPENLRGRNMSMHNPSSMKGKSQEQARNQNEDVRCNAFNPQSNNFLDVKTSGRGSQDPSTNAALGSLRPNPTPKGSIFQKPTATDSPLYERQPTNSASANSKSGSTNVVVVHSRSQRGGGGHSIRADSGKKMETKASELGTAAEEQYHASRSKANLVDDKPFALPSQSSLEDPLEKLLAIQRSKQPS